MEKKQMTEQARLLKNKQLREWRKKNPDRVRQHEANYWNKRVEKLQEKEGVSENV